MLRSRPATAGVLATALLLVGGAAPGTAAADSWAHAAGVSVQAATTLVPGAGATSLTPRMPADAWALSATLRMAPGAALRIVGPRGRPIARLRARADGRLAVTTATTPGTAARRPSAARAWTHRLELVAGPTPRLAVDATALPVGAVGRVTLVADGSGPVLVQALTVTPARRRDAALLHRVADLQARTAQGRFPLGESDAGRLHFSGGWTSGFWPGALWDAATLVPRGPYGDWALDASLARMHGEDTLIHDLGFMFGHSVVRAHERLCRAAASARCRRLRASGLAAADTLARLAATSAAGTIPTDATGPVAQTIVDSVMNLGLLTWATRVTGDAAYAALARRHATIVRALLLRPDGSTIQAADHDRATGALLGLHTRQGLSDASTWSRAQAWAIHGLADVGRDLGDGALVGAAERAAGYWMATAPAGRVPPYDFSAAPGAPRDSSAAAIAAAGMYRLALACRSVPGACATPARWSGAAGRTLEAALTAVSTRPPLGRFGDQAYRVGPRGGSWDDRAEFIWGIDFALEAVAARHRAAQAATR